MSGELDVFRYGRAGLVTGQRASFSVWSTSSDFTSCGYPLGLGAAISTAVETVPLKGTVDQI
jgi:hypothetical protein